MTLTTERLKELLEELKSWQYGYDPVDDKEQFDMLATAEWAVIELLANREAQPVYQMRLLDGTPEQHTWVEVTHEEFNLPLKNPDEWSKRVLFTAPPAPAIPDIGSSVVNDAAWKLHDTLTEHGPLNGHQFNNLKVCLYEALKIVMFAPPAPAVPDDYQHLKNVQELYNSQEERLFSLAQRIKGVSFDKYSHTTAQAIDVLERAIFGDDGNDFRAAMLAQPVSGGYTLPDNVREALTLALQAMEFMGDTLNNIDAVCTEDVEYVTPAFNAVRELLAAAPEGGNG